MIYTICICDSCGRGNDDGVRVGTYRMRNKAFSTDVPVEKWDTGEYCKECLQKVKVTHQIEEIDA